MLEDHWVLIKKNKKMDWRSLFMRCSMYALIVLVENVRLMGLLVENSEQQYHIANLLQQSCRQDPQLTLR